MSSFRYEKTYSFTGSKKDLISIKKYLVAKDEEDQEYAVFHLINNYKEVVNAVTFEVKQFDSEKNLLATNVIPYEDLKIKSKGKFVPFVKLALDDHTESIETKVIDAKFENHIYANGKLKRVKKPKEPKKTEETKVLKDSINKDVKSLKSKYPVKSFIILSAIVLVITALFVGIFSLSNRTIVINDIGIDTATGTITRYYGESKSIVIPEKLKNTEVKKIGTKAFSGTNIRDITFDCDVSIESYAFLNCLNLVTVTSNGKVTKIGDYAFQNCPSLETIDVEGVQTVGDGAFKKCSNLLKFESETCTSIGSGAFVDCNRLEVVKVPKAMLCSMTFENNVNLEEVVFGEVESLYSTTLSRIFSNTNNLEDVNISTYMGHIRFDFINGFTCASLNFVNPDVVIDSDAKALYELNAKSTGNYVDNGSYTRIYNTIVAFDASKFASSLYLVDENIKGITTSSLSELGNKITALHIDCDMMITSSLLNCFPNATEMYFGKDCIIDSGAFYNNSRLTTLTMPIANDKFIECFKFLPTSLSVKINDSGSIPDEYFSDASTVKKIEIAGTINELGKNVFKGCINLEEIIISQNVSTMGSPLISNDCFNLKKVTLPLIGTDIDNPVKYLDLNKSGTFTTKLVINNVSLINLAENCFEKCSMIDTLYIQGGITGTLKDTFKGLSGLKKLKICNSAGTLISDMFGSAPTIDYLAIEDAQIPDEYFKGAIINNLYLAGSTMISDNSFTANDLIINISTSTYVFMNPSSTTKIYSDLFEQIMTLKNINFENKYASYNGKKTSVKGFDFNTEYNNIFE